jgi:tetratricopeptide (TPR) repeat protein
MKQFIAISIGFVIFICSCKNKQDEAAEKKQKPLPEYVNNMMLQLKQNPDSIALRFKLVEALDSISEFKIAVAEIDSIIKRDSLNYGVWFKKGDVLKRAQDTTAAIASFTKASKIYTSPQVLLELANLYAEKADKRALIYCQQVADLRLGREYDSYIDFFAGVYFARTNDKKKALEYFDKSINENYSLIDNYLEKGLIYYNDKNYKEALKIFNTASSISNTNADVYYWLGKTYEAMNDKTNAISNYKKSLLLDKNLKEAEDAIKRVEN